MELNRLQKQKQKETQGLIVILSRRIILICLQFFLLPTRHRQLSKREKDLRWERFERDQERDIYQEREIRERDQT